MVHTYIHYVLTYIHNILYTYIRTYIHVHTMVHIISYHLVHIKVHTCMYMYKLTKGKQMASPKEPQLIILKILKTILRDFHAWKMVCKLHKLVCYRSETERIFKMTRLFCFSLKSKKLGVCTCDGCVRLCTSRSCARVCWVCLNAYVRIIRRLRLERCLSLWGINGMNGAWYSIVNTDVKPRPPPNSVLFRVHICLFPPFESTPPPPYLRTDTISEPPFRGLFAGFSCLGDPPKSKKLLNSQYTPYIYFITPF